MVEREHSTGRADYNGVTEGDNSTNCNIREPKSERSLFESHENALSDQDRNNDGGHSSFDAPTEVLYTSISIETLYE